MADDSVRYSTFVVTGDEVVFATAGPMKVPAEKLTALPLVQQRANCHVHIEPNGGVAFDTEGWYEVLLRVEWDADDVSGTRFAHTKIPDQEPLHSEAIDSSVLARISQGRQLLRGNCLFGPDRTTSLVLEVWHDSDGAVEVAHAELIVRELHVPWNPDGDASTAASERILHSD